MGIYLQFTTQFIQVSGENPIKNKHWFQFKQIMRKNKEKDGPSDTH